MKIALQVGLSKLDIPTAEISSSNRDRDSTRDSTSSIRRDSNPQAAHQVTRGIQHTLPRLCRARSWAYRS